MCVVCILWEKGNLTAKEADRALVELLNEDDFSDDVLIHFQEVVEQIKKEGNK